MMRPGTVFFKTEKGDQEINQRRGELSLRDRRILMLVNGVRTLEEIAQLARTARVENYTDILDTLLADGFVTYRGAPGSQPVSRPAAPPAESGGPPAPSTQAGDPGSARQLSETQEFMLNSLKAYTNPRRVMALSRSIAAVRSDGELRDLMDPWHEAISDSPQGIFHADDLRVKLLEKLVRGG